MKDIETMIRKWIRPMWEAGSKVLSKFMILNVDSMIRLFKNLVKIFRISNSVAIRPIGGIREIGETGTLLPGLPGAQTGALPQFFILHLLAALPLQVPCSIFGCEAVI
jgi:hypothetical protein